MAVLSIIGWICASLLICCATLFIVSRLLKPSLILLILPYAFFYQLFRYKVVLVLFTLALIPSWHLIEWLAEGHLSILPLLLLIFLISLIPSLLIRAFIASRARKI